MRQQGRGRAFDMGNGRPGGHPADIAGAYQLIRAQAVLVLDLAFKQIGQGRQTNMRMLSDIHPLTGWVVRQQHVVEKHKWPDTAAFGRRQGTQDRLAFDILGARANHGQGRHGAFPAMEKR